MWVLKTDQHNIYQSIGNYDENTTALSKSPIANSKWQVFDEKPPGHSKAAKLPARHHLTCMQGRIALWPWPFCLWQKIHMKWYESMWIKVSGCWERLEDRFIESINWCMADSRKHVVPTKIPQAFLASTDYRTVRDKVSFQLPAMQLAEKAQGLIANHGLQGLRDMLPIHSRKNWPVSYGQY